MRHRAVFAAAVVLLGTPALADSPAPASSEISAVAEDAFVYGYPLVLMKQTEQQMTTGEDGAPVGRFRHFDEVATPAERVVVRPNTDTLYSTAWLDLATGPVVLHVPDTSATYVVVQMLDAWTNVFAAPGTRTTGTAAHDFVLVAPGFRGALPPELMPVEASTNTVWIVARTLIPSAAELPRVRALQEQYTLTPLDVWGRAAPAPRASRASRATPRGPTPPEVVAAMSGIGFLQRLASDMAVDAAPRRDAPMLKRLATIGFAPGALYAPDAKVASVLDAAKERAFARIAGATKAALPLVNGWRVLLHGVGDYGTDYDTRAAVAAAGLGANLPEDAVYPTAVIDGSGQPLTGDRDYVVHFSAGQLPPVNAFWSLTLYDASGYLVPNAIGRYALRDRDALCTNDDGSLDLYIQPSSPGSAREGNWLPSPAGAPFSLTLRLYWPKPAVLDGTWSPPPVEALEEHEGY
jgi:hypothetical protein